MYNFVFVQAFIFGCAQRSGWPSVASQCMSHGHESISDTFDFLKSNRPGNPRQVCPKLKHVVSGRRLVIAVLLKVGGGTSLIYECIYKTQHTPKLCICYCFLLKDCGPAKSDATAQSTRSSPC